MAEIKWTNTGEGLRTYMESNQDTPIAPSVFENPTIYKKKYTIESCWGHKGLYKASNLQGEWEFAGPFGGQ